MGRDGVKLITYMFAMIAEVIIWLAALRFTEGVASFVLGAVIFVSFGAIFGRISQYKEDAQ